MNPEGSIKVPLLHQSMTSYTRKAVIIRPGLPPSWGVLSIPFASELANRLIASRYVLFLYRHPEENHNTPTQFDILHLFRRRKKNRLCFHYIHSPGSSELDSRLFSEISTLRAEVSIILKARGYFQVRVVFFRFEHAHTPFSKYYGWIVWHNTLSKSHNLIVWFGFRPDIRREFPFFPAVSHPLPGE